MKRSLVSRSALRLFLAAIPALSVSPALAEPPHPPHLSPRTISVTGEAVVRTAPDQVIIHLAVESAGTDLAAILAETDARAGRIRAIARDFKIAAEHVQTDSISLQRRYIDSKPSGYTAQRSIVLCMKDLGRVNALLNEVVKSGANRIDSISFETSQLRRFRDEARVQAVRAAKQKAQLLAAELAAQVGKPLSITEGTGAIQHAGGGGYQNFAREEPGTASTEGGFAAGQIAVNAYVSVVFQLD
jgi:uncharacterized protein YggE